MAGHDAAAANMNQQQQQRRNPILAFAQSATGSDSKLALPDAVWLSRAANMLQTVALPFAFYFKPVVVFIAMSWLCYRAYQVMNKPLEELAGLLGFDIPCEPTIDLATIKSDGAIVHWSLPEKTRHKTSFKFEVHLNGAVIDTFAIHETAATIYGLQPGCFYVVRVSLVNNVEFSSRSDPIRFRTKAASSNDFFVPPLDGNDTDADEPHVPVPRARPYKGLKDITPANADTTPMAREGSSGLGPKRSLTGGRRHSPAAINLDKHDPPADENEPPEGAETIHHLTEKLDQIRRETEEADRQAREEEEEEMRLREELNKQRDELKAEVTENDKNSRNLKKEVNTLDRHNTAAQAERRKQAGILEQKKQERQKLKDDMVRWEQEAEVMRREVDNIRQKKEDYTRDAQKEKGDLHVKLADEAAAVKALDEEVREKGTEFKKLDRLMKNNSPSESSEFEPNFVQQHQQDAEETRLYELQRSQMQSHYTAAFQKVEQAKRFYAEQRAYLDQLRARRAQEEAAQYVSPPTTQERLPHRGDSQRSRRAQSGHSSSDSPRLANFPITSAPFSSGMTSTMSPFSSAPFLNFTNGMTVAGPTDELQMSDEERERITGGAPMSPGAGVEFLPADLFGEGDNKLSSTFIQPLPGLGALPGLGGMPSSTHQVLADPGPASPASGGSSRSPSVFASPQASQQNLHLGSPENILESDGRSIRSTRSNRATSGSGAGSRFSAMFGIKQRAKTNPADEPPALGKAQSHSMPRTDQGIPGIDSNTRKRNSSISGSAFALGSDGEFDPPAAPPPTTSMRSRAFNLFSRQDKSDGWPSSFPRRPSSPRPGSTHSNELPRPSFDSNRWGVGVDGWPSNDAAGGARSSPLAFGSSTGWNAPSSQQSRLFGSRHPSRRPSAQYGASGPPEDILEDEDSDEYDSDRGQQLGAIGTRPPPGSKKADKAPTTDANPKLNPNAKSFTGWFGSKKGRSKETASGSGTPNLDKGDWDESPPNGRKSKDTRDTRSITTAESSLAESSRNSTELARTPSYTTSDVAPSPLLGGSSAGKESFMQKLSRKSSSSKFALPTFKREKSKMDGSLSSATSAPTEEEDADLSASVSSLQQPRESKEVSRGSGRNWSSVLKIGSVKKKGNETPSLSGMSMTTSGTEDNEEE
ncbi:hypothetical protein DOTSEDRAFT_86681 [Dothistroma septosporum NZE10]|uniref:Fibronectin type-III domain-containing protein n=1 Tax=Dothistroma septosporum (strain NZE10 / CBS 128990) TaxID=675120 RepID=N1PRE4_DOTSN|nr:hypothetical protein DOTSEDRAFT_86681 [Dothistroma septosporum NZE10]